MPEVGGNKPVSTDLTKKKKGGIYSRWHYLRTVSPANQDWRNRINASEGLQRRRAFHSETSQSYYSENRSYVNNLKFSTAYLHGGSFSSSVMSEERRNLALKELEVKMIDS